VFLNDVRHIRNFCAFPDEKAQLSYLSEPKSNFNFSKFDAMHFVAHRNLLNFIKAGENK
jgi:hypothetical protein